MTTILAVALFAGATPSNSQNWTATWTQKAYPAGSPNGPGGRGWVDLTYDSVNRRMVLMGGGASNDMDDVWWYDGASDRWSPLEPPFTCSQINDFVPPTGREEHAVEYDPINQLYWMFGGSGTSCVGPNRTAGTGTIATAIVDRALTAATVNAYKDWTVQVNNTYAYVTAYDPAAKKLTLSNSVAGAVPGARYVLYPQRGGGTWYYSPVSRTWGSLTGPRWGYTGPSPLNRLSPSMAFSSRDNAMVMFGGHGNSDTWALDIVAKQWTQRLPGGAAGSPPARAQITNSMVYDSANDVFILFGGCLCTGSSGPSAGDTWVYRLSTNTWTNMTPIGSPPPRQAHNMVYDSANQVVVLFGGYDYATGKLFNDLWVYSYTTNTWTQIFPSVSPPPRWIAGMAYDPVNRLTVLYAGGTTTGSMYDMWALNLQGASAVNPAPSLTSLSAGTATVGGSGFTLTVTGANFVSGSIVRWNGAGRPTTYVRSTGLQAAIAAGDIASTGSAQVSVFTPGPGGGTSNALPVTITASSPVPTLASLSPSSATAGAPSFVLSATGTGFGPSSVVRWNGSSRTTTLVSSTKLQATIAASDIASAGTAQVSVFTSGPGGGTSGLLPFTVGARPGVPSNPVPTLTSISPGSATVGGPGFLLTVTGTGFGPTSTVSWNGSARTTTFLSSTQLQAGMHSTDLLVTGTAQVSMSTPGPGGGSSGALPFTIGASTGVPSIPAPTPPINVPTAPVAGQWATLPNTRVFDAMDGADFYSGPAAYNPQSLFAFSGGDLLQLNGVWGFVLTGGGHAATPDNSTLFVPFDGSGPRQLQGPYVTPDRNYKYDEPYEAYLPLGVWTDARKSRHTYSSFLAIQKTGKPFLWVYGGSLFTGAGGGTAATRLFDLAQTRPQAMASPSMGWPMGAGAPRGAVSSAAGWDPVKKRVVVRSRSFVGAYYPDQDRWEDWNVRPVATLCCDFAAAVAMDIVGRKMYVLGDGLAEMYDLDTNGCPLNSCYADLSGKPWAQNFALRGVGYPASPGVSWHARTRQIVAWVGGQNLLVINPATDTMVMVTMGGASVSAAEGSGTFGRFRVVPGTDQVVLVNSVTENVFIGTVPFDGTALPPSPPTPAPAPVTLNAPGSITWTAPANPDGTSFNLTVSFTSVPMQFPAGTVPARYRVTLRQQSNNVVLIPYGGTPSTAGRPDTGGLLWTAIGPGSYDVTITLEDTSGAVLSTAGPTTFVLETGSGTPPPPPSPSPSPSPGTVAVPPGQPLPIRTWVERPLPPIGQAFMAGNGGKHGRAFYHAGLKGLAFAGGDWHSSMETQLGLDGNFEGSEVWTLNAATDRWTLQRPVCVPGEPQPGRPDTVTWAYDSRRDRGLMAPGFYGITQGGPYPNGPTKCGAVEGFGGYAFSFATKKFTGPDAAAGLPAPPGGWGGDSGASFGLYDPINDELIRVRNAPQLERLNLGTLTWRVQSLRITPTWNPVPNRAQLVIDVGGRAVYFLDAFGDAGGFAGGVTTPPRGRALIKVSLTDGSTTVIPLPPQYAPPGDQSQEVYLAFDPINRLVLVPNNIGMGQSPIQGLGIYHADTGQWEWEAVPEAVWGSVWGFDENIGAMIGIGKRAWGTSYFIYKPK